jgi:hypothetical protein
MFSSAGVAVAANSHYKNFKEIPYDELPPIFEATVNGEHFMLALGKDSIPRGINEVDAVDIAMEGAELQARAKLAEFMNSGELEKTNSRSKAYSSTEGNEQSVNLRKDKGYHASQTTRTETIRGVKLIFVKKDVAKGEVSVLVGLSRNTVESADTFREMLKQNHARSTP